MSNGDSRGPVYVKTAICLRVLIDFTILLAKARYHTLCRCEHDQGTFSPLHPRSVYIKACFRASAWVEGAARTTIRTVIAVPLWLLSAVWQGPRTCISLTKMWKANFEVRMQALECKPIPLTLARSGQWRLQAVQKPTDGAMSTNDGRRC